MFPFTDEDQVDKAMSLDTNVDVNGLLSVNAIAG
jgi:hypothetical protein